MHEEWLENQQEDERRELERQELERMHERGEI